MCTKERRDLNKTQRKYIIHEDCIQSQQKLFGPFIVQAQKFKPAASVEEEEKERLRGGGGGGKWNGRTKEGQSCRWKPGTIINLRNNKFDDNGELILEKSLLFLSRFIIFPSTSYQLGLR